KKWQQKIYYRHSGYVGGLKSEDAATVAAKDPTEVLRRAVKGMLPKNKLRTKRLNKLKLYPDAEHTHQAQSPTSGENLR
ncbi:MAG: uL13 family ribosomal protein, partial [Pseudomonadota bacterium]|nr:uL13 family ribosomal protein [Pseudomonadota bacterium]